MQQSTLGPTKIKADNLHEFKARYIDLRMIRTHKQHRSQITDVKFRPNSYECVTISEDRSLKLWDLE